MNPSAINELLAIERKATVLQVLQNHVGAANGTHEAELVAATMLNGRLCRKAIELLRLDGVRIGGRPSTGYFIAQTDDELADTFEFMTKRAITTFRQLAAMKRVGMAQLFGQMNLPD